jgi:hypothetical protein
MTALTLDRERADSLLHHGEGRPHARAHPRRLSAVPRRADRAARRDALRPGEVPIAAGADGIIRVSRGPEDLFRPETIASFNGKSISNDHPDEDVNPDNWRQITVGVVLNPREGEGEDQGYLVTDFLITDARRSTMSRAGKVEVSCGYDADYEETGPGRGRQFNIIGNHVALVDKGRCGPTLFNQGPRHEDPSAPSSGPGRTASSPPSRRVTKKLSPKPWRWPRTRSPKASATKPGADKTLVIRVEARAPRATDDDAEARREVKKDDDRDQGRRSAGLVHQGARRGQAPGATASKSASARSKAHGPPTRPRRTRATTKDDAEERPACAPRTRSGGEGETRTRTTRPRTGRRTGDSAGLAAPSRTCSPAPRSSRRASSCRPSTARPSEEATLDRMCAFRRRAL